MQDARRLRRGAVVAAALAIVLAAVAWYALRWFSLRFEVSNEFKAPVRQLEIRVTGDADQLDVLDPSESCRGTLRVGGDSHISVSWLDAAGAQHAADADVYLNRGEGGEFEARINELGQLEWSLEHRLSVPLSDTVSEQGTVWDTRAGAGK